MNNETTIHKLKTIIKRFKQQTITSITIEQLQELLSMDNERPYDAIEASNYLKVKLTTLYSYTHKKLLTCYRPTGRKLYFLKSDLDAFLLGKEIKSIEKLTEQLNKGGK